MQCQTKKKIIAYVEDNIFSQPSAPKKNIFSLSFILSHTRTLDHNQNHNPTTPTQHLYPPCSITAPAELAPIPKVAPPEPFDDE